MPDALMLWTIYNHPSNAPDHFIARKWLVSGGESTMTDEVFKAGTLEELRKLLPPGLYHIPRSDEDDSTVIESWL